MCVQSKWTAKAARAVMCFRWVVVLAEATQCKMDSLQRSEEKVMDGRLPLVQMETVWRTICRSACPIVYCGQTVTDRAVVCIEEKPWVGFRLT